MGRHHQPEAALLANRRLSALPPWEQARLRHSRRPVERLSLAEDSLPFGAMRVVLVVAVEVVAPGVAQRAGCSPSC